jgi:predicted sulfurtransferase
MAWDSEFYVPKNNISARENETEKNKEKKLIHCASCNEPIGVVSTIIYEIEEKHYCSECYSRTIITLAVDRDHFDLKHEKASLKK